MLCPMSGEHDCVICKGKGSLMCEDCRGTGFRAGWMPGSAKPVPE